MMKPPSRRASRDTQPEQRAGVVDCFPFLKSSVVWWQDLLFVHLVLHHPTVPTSIARVQVAQVRGPGRLETILQDQEGL